MRRATQEEERALGTRGTFWAVPSPLPSLPPTDSMYPHPTPTHPTPLPPPGPPRSSNHCWSSLPARTPHLAAGPLRWKVGGGATNGPAGVAVGGAWPTGRAVVSSQLLGRGRPTKQKGHTAVRGEDRGRVGRGQACPQRCGHRAGGMGQPEALEATRVRSAPGNGGAHRRGSLGAVLRAGGGLLLPAWGSGRSFFRWILFGGLTHAAFLSSVKLKMFSKTFFLY